MDSLSVTAKGEQRDPWNPQSIVGLLQAWHQAAKCYTFQSTWYSPNLHLPTASPQSCEKGKGRG